MAKRRRIWIGIGLFLVAYGVFAVMTLGLVVFNDRDFSGQKDIELVNGLKSDVWLVPKSSGFGIPFLFGYRGTGGPYGLRLQIWDTSLQYRTIEISEIVVKYDDRPAVHKDYAWSRRLEPYVQHNSSPSGDIETEMFMLSDEIEGLIERHADVTITLKGELTTATGDLVPFEASEFFHAESRHEITTGWSVLARM